MTTYTKQLATSFGSSHSGQSANVTYSVYNGGSLVRGPITGTLTESLDASGAASTGAYWGSDANFDTSWAGRIEYTVSGVSGLAAVATYGPDAAQSASDASASQPGSGSSSVYAALTAGPQQSITTKFAFGTGSPYSVAYQGIEYAVNAGTSTIPQPIAALLIAQGLAV